MKNLYRFLIYIVTAVLSLAVTIVTASIGYAADNSDNGGVVLLYIIILITAAAIFFLPSIIAFNRQHPNRWIIFIINLIFGATLLGWLICLVWSLNAIHVPKTGSNGGQSGLNIFANDEKMIRVANIDTSVSKRSMADHIKELEQLKALFEADGITSDEYEVMRKKILSNIT